MVDSRIFILLRGYPESGKSRTAKELTSKLRAKGKNPLGLDLDSFFPSDEELQFWSELEKAANEKIVIAELFSGDWHRSDPNRWIGTFKDFTKYSFLLDVSFSTGFSRANDARRDLKITSRADYESLTGLFWIQEKQEPFFIRAGLLIEKRLNAEKGDYSQLADTILNDTGL